MKYGDCKFSLAAGALLLSSLSAQAAELRFPVSTFGTPGLIDMPTGEMYADGQVRITTALHNKTQRHTLAFQIAPRVFGTFRYAILDDYTNGSTTRWDRSFDIGYLLAKENAWRPSIAVGLRDFGGTGVYSSEYIAATKHFGERLAVTGGIGWGRLGTYGGFTNPLSFLGDSFETAERTSSDVTESGRLQADQWFRGDAALFGGFAYQVSDRWSLAAEYSSDAYEQEVASSGFDRKTPFNVALSYGFKKGASITGYVLSGSDVGIMLSLPITPQAALVPGGLEKAPPALNVRASAASQSWNSTDISIRQSAQNSLKDKLAEQGLLLEALDVGGDTARIQIINARYGASAQSIGRASRVLANELPNSVKTFEVELMAHGLPVSRTRLRRQDLERFEHDLDGSWGILTRAQIEDAAGSKPRQLDGVYPRFDWDVRGYAEPAIFDPDSPVRADIGAQFSADVAVTPKLFFSTAVRQPLWGNLEESDRPSDSVLPHVRTDVANYIQQSDLAIKYLTAEYFFRPAENVFGRATLGYLETMYGGVSGELLWRPVNSRLALGAELNYVKQRDFDQLFGFQDYSVVTGHASAYYDFGGGYLGQVDAGRYLAGDWGTTVSLDREFNNGFSVGAFFTLTDVSFEDFGEGAFDKGIRFSIPVEWLTGEPNRNGFGTTIRPVQRDGGARLSVRNRLFHMTRDAQTNELEDRWGRFWR